MKTYTPSIVTLALATVGALLAQDLTGTWQGTLTPAPGKDLRVVFKIAKADSGSGMKGTLFSIDQGGTPIGASGVTIDGTAVKIAIAAIAGGFEGKMSGDGKTISGNWSQGPGNMPLTLTRATAETAWAIPEPPARPKPMAPDVDPNVEVATIKPSQPDAPGRMITVNGRLLVTRNTPLSSLMTFAYGIHPKQIVGAPAWVESDRFDIEVQPEQQGLPDQRQLKVLLQKLMADRFKLTFHKDKRELSVYTISVEKTGHKLTKSHADPNGLPGLMFRGLGNLPAINATIGDFAGVLQAVVLDRPVVDQTGIEGKFDFAINWTPDEFQFASLGARPPQPADNAAAPPDIYTAMREQLGLKLSATKAPAEVVVVDNVERPSAN